MNWDAIGAVGEVLGATVVFITLVYLAMQVKSAKLTAIDANRLARAKGVTDMQCRIRLKTWRNWHIRSASSTDYL